MAKWLDFRVRPRPADRKTDIYEVWNKDGIHYLGTVGWYPPWRCYSFFPSGRNLVFERTCLRDIADFLDQLMEERKWNLVFERTCLRDIADFLDQLMEERKQKKANDSGS